MGTKDLRAFALWSFEVLVESLYEYDIFFLCTHVMHNVITCLWQLTPFLNNGCADYFEIIDELKIHFLCS